MRRSLRIAVLVLLLCLSLPAFAVDGYVSADVNLRSGPGTEYPSVMVVPKWTGLQVQGCVDGYSWCDVQAGPDRGWVYVEYLEFVQGGEPVYINDNAPQLGIPIVVFSLGTYWDTYYRTRPWYGNRGYWINHRPIYRPLPPRRPGVRPPPRPPIGGRPPITRPPVTRPPVTRPPVTRPPVTRPPVTRPPGGNGPGGRPPITTPLPRPPGNGGPGGRPQPNPGNGGNRPGPGPGDSNSGRPPPRPQPQRPQPRPAPQNDTQNRTQNGT